MIDEHHQEIARCLFRESNDALFIFDPRDHRVVDVNPVAMRITGYDREAAGALRLWQLFTSAEPASLSELIDAYQTTGFFHSREGFFLARERGEPLPVNLSVSRIHTRPHPLGLVVARDVSERKRAQEQLQESERRFRGLVETARVLIWTVSAAGVITSVNPEFEVLTGWLRDEWLGRPVEEMIHPEDAQSVLSHLRAATVNGSAPMIDARVATRHDTYLDLELLSISRVVEGKATGVSVIARDVTEQKRAVQAITRAEEFQRAKEAAEIANEAKSQFLAHVSHEIRSPMTAILGFTDLLARHPYLNRPQAPVDILEDLGIIRENGTQLIGIIDDLLDLTRVEMGKLHVAPGPCDPTELVEYVAASLRVRSEAKGVPLLVEAMTPLPAAIQTDAVRLRQILMNLCGNAIGYTERGSIRLRVRHLQGAAAPPSGPALQFEVVDTGIGIEPNDIGHIFEPFYRALQSDRPAPPGMGLGLAISRRLAVLLGGELSAESAPGRGSTFRLTLPTGCAGDDAGARHLGEEEAPAARPGLVWRPTHLDCRVLVAEDNDASRRAIALHFEQAGASVDLAHNGQAALELTLNARKAGQPFDVIVMDMQMPVLDGYEATRQIRANHIATPIIALTANAMAEDREECLAIGCDEHLSKPIDWRRLFELVSAFMPRRPKVG